MSKVSCKLFAGAVLVLFVTMLLPSVLIAGQEEDYSLAASRISSFKQFEAEELINYAQLQELLKISQANLTTWGHKFQQIALAERSSLASPMQRKRLKNRLGNLGQRSLDMLDDLKQAREDCSARLEILNSFTRAWTSAPDGAPEDVVRMLSDGLRDVKKLKADSEKQLQKIDYQLKLAMRLQDRIDGLDKGEKNNLFQLWNSWLLDGKDPAFIPEFWHKILPSKAWMDLKKSEFNSAGETLNNGFVRFAFIVLALFTTGLFLIRMMDKSDYFQNRSEIERWKSLRLMTIACLSFAIYGSAKAVFGDSLDAVALMAFGVFYWSVLRLSKLICREKVRFVTGEARAALLFIVSGLLLEQQVPGRLVICIFLLVLAAFWAYGMYRNWRRGRLQGMSIISRKDNLLFPLFLVALFGYGRLACVFAILWSLGLFIRGFGSAWTHILFHRTEMSVQLKKGLVRSLAVPAGWSVGIGLAAFWLSDFFGRSAVASLMELNYTHDDYSISLGSLVWLAIVFFMTRQCVSAFNISIEYVGSRWAKGKRGAVPSIQTLFTYAVWSLFSLVGLNVLGLSLTSITVIAGGLSVGIGFGLQNIVNNFIGGLILLFGRSIQQGDVIEIGGLWCTVRKINIRTTLVETFENAVIMIPNSDLVATQVTNWTKNNSIIRRDILVGVAYGSDIDKVKAVLLGLAAAHTHVLKNPAPYVHFNNFGNSSLDFILRVWIDDIDVTLVTMSELRFAIDKAFREEKIEIAFPQLDIHVRDIANAAG
ncbi:mechanosensitive ion channel family protein [Maridesulfovibrio sp. FT414]|uniref:mechanosensitive ion channel family protein n=1 Tax=Maridesulfovibrio sp. FT414 TaxID=2979469 RepID=UPI003D803F8B